MKKLVLLAVLCGCVTVPMARRDLDESAKILKPPPDAANVYVYRTSSLFGIAVTLAVYLDEVWVGNLAPGTFTMLTVRPGEHKLLAKREGSSELTLVVEPGRNYYAKTSLTWSPGAAIEMVTDEKVAQDDIRGCGLIASAAAETIRYFAAEVAKTNVDAVGLETLVATASRAVEAMGGRPRPFPAAGPRHRHRTAPSLAAPQIHTGRGLAAKSRRWQLWAHLEAGWARGVHRWCPP